MILYLEDSPDPHGLIIAKNSLILKDWMKVDEIKKVEIDMSKCGRDDNATETLSRMIDKYESENQKKLKAQQSNVITRLIRPVMRYMNISFNSQNETGYQDRYNNALERLYTLRGLLLYHRGKYKEAISDFNMSLTYNPSNIEIRFYTLFANIMLDEDAEAYVYVQKVLKKLEADPTHNKNPWVLATSSDYSDIIRQKDYKRVVPPSQLFTDVWPTHLEFAELSNIAYCKDRLTSLPHWSFIDEFNDTDKTGYYSIAVQHNETKEMVIAHRGTTFDVNNASLLADFDLFSLKIPEQFQVAQQFTNKIRQQIDPKRILWHTGHSLGGAIAEFIVANETLFKQESLSFAVTFDSPGIRELLKDHRRRSKIEQSLPKSNEFRVIGYLSVPNIVNTMGTHIGLTLRLSPDPPLPAQYHPLAQIVYTHVTAQFNHLKGILDALVAEANKQLHWHSIRTIIECFKSWPNKSGLPTILKSVIKWPKGVQKLVCFLSLASQHNLTTLDVTYDLNKDHKALDDFESCNYHVIDSRIDLFFGLPLELWNSKAQCFLEQFINHDFKNKNVTIRYNHDCELVKFVGVDNMQIILNILHWKTNHIYPDMKMIGFNKSAIPIYNEQIYKINILNIYKLFSLVNLDNCVLSIVDSPK
ncbi:unnamed protein product [Adineta steineri]|uniref:Fungal lipase-like domain-containing protein n=1 Tax=Adineta steineri TaxID=433720 RepID=A0A813ZK55_9BILA|nr:unnamed protein product [Adineta steineri]CAF1130311.1 unnamed protein product [Adineta steineri]